MLGIYCNLVGKFERGQMFRKYCIHCVHNTAHLGDEQLLCRYLEYRVTYQPKHKKEAIPSKEPAIWIPPDMRG